MLTNSKPFTQSGYTVRSHEVLKCQLAVGIKAQAVTRLGYPVLVGKIPRAAQQLIDGVIYRRLLPGWYPFRLADRNSLAVQKVVAEARKFGATILHTTTDYTNAMVVAEAARRLRIPWVYEIRGELESTWLARQPKEQQSESETAEYFCLAHEQETQYMVAADAVIALSEVSQRQLVDRGIPAEKITVVPNAVDAGIIGRRFDQKAIRRELGLDEGTALVGTVTAVVDYEGIDTLIDALPLLPQRYEALVVGDGAARPALEEQAKILGVADRIKFVGRQPNEDIWRWYAALDVFVVPRRDTKVTRTVTPIKPLTAMALDIPVVASDLPALRDVTGGRAEFVLSEDPRALAQGILAAAVTAPRGSEWAGSRTWAENGQRYRNLYYSLSNPKAV
ncbi:glycosyltransferase family 4 protein [Corynebacterium guangdongense]|uniref:Glycosyltransferase involved in cell wall biosynthesis n=1 Tax=Corynebacterium guangdongense TaxID=1783348 RepID=A0ABU1ZY79_9CORY|nr:glycosyltransferase family 4 protein [Corynebacterium guangdongense]MDR7329897.1 glycosyltransferase involved in cell wall biosynthesis [Corynebacterium guangdongense]